MPTGYTAAIEKGIDFDTFVWQCARSFGALVTMRDEPSDTPIPELFEPTDYHTKKLDELNAELSKLDGMGIKELDRASRDAFNKEMEATAYGIDKANSLRRKYEEMLADVEAWNPPTTEHNGLKAFMQNQITESIKFDCSTSFYVENAPKLKSGNLWLAERKAKIHKDIAYHSQAHADEVTRVDNRNKWVAALRDSLKK